MNAQFLWQDIFALASVRNPVGYLKAMSILWDVPVRSIVEIGVFRGASSQLFRSLFPEATLYLVDPWRLSDEYLTKEAGPIARSQDIYERAYQEVVLRFANDPKTEIIRQTSIEAAKGLPNNLDLVFIDANHSYPSVKQDIAAWLPKMQKRGILSGHDYDLKGFPGVVRAVDEYFPGQVLIGPGRTWIRPVSQP